LHVHPLCLLTGRIRKGIDIPRGVCCHRGLSARSTSVSCDTYGPVENDRDGRRWHRDGVNVHVADGIRVVVSPRHWKWSGLEVATLRIDEEVAIDIVQSLYRMMIAATIRLSRFKRLRAFPLSAPTHGSSESRPHLSPSLNHSLAPAYSTPWLSFWQWL
jgi:hypothetical protein